MLRGRTGSSRYYRLSGRGQPDFYGQHRAAARGVGQLQGAAQRTGAFTSNEREIALSLDHATALFRIFQEALTNIAKHARASQVTVRLQRLDALITLTIADNGRGIAAADRSKPESFGLRGMNERARALGGTMTLSDAPGGGSVVTIKIALPAARPAIMDDALRTDQTQQ